MTSTTQASAARTPIKVTPRIEAMYEGSRGLPGEIQDTEREIKNALDYVRTISTDKQRNTTLEPTHPALAGVREMTAGILEEAWWNARNSSLPPTSETVRQVRAGVAQLRSAVDRIDSGKPVNVDQVANSISKAAKRFDKARTASFDETRALEGTIRLLAGHGGDPYDGADFAYLKQLGGELTEAGTHVTKAKTQVYAAIDALRTYTSDPKHDRFTSVSALPPTIGPALTGAESSLVEAYQNTARQPTGTHRTASDANDKVKLAVDELYHKGSNGWNDVDTEMLGSAMRDAWSDIDHALIVNKVEVEQLATAAKLARRDPDNQSSDFHRGPWNEPTDWRAVPVK